MEKREESTSEIRSVTDSESQIVDQSSIQGDDDEFRDGGEAPPLPPASLPARFAQVAEHQAGGEKESSAGIVYLSRIPPYMSVNKVRHLLSQFGTVARIFLQPEDRMARRRRKRQGGKRKRRFEEGWVEFRDKKVAKAVAASLNSTPVGGKKGNFHYFDLWTVKYLHGFKWRHLTESIAYQSAVRDQRLRAEISQARRENQFYLQGVEKGREVAAIEERKLRQGKALEVGPDRRHPQNQVLAEGGVETGGLTSLAFLAKILPNSVND